MIAARRDAPRGAPIANEKWCITLFDAVVGVENRRMNDRSEPLTGRVRRIRRNQHLDEDLIPLKHLVEEVDPSEEASCPASAAEESRVNPIMKTNAVALHLIRSINFPFTSAALKGECLPFRECGRALRRGPFRLERVLM